MPINEKLKTAETAAQKFYEIYQEIQEYLKATDSFKPERSNVQKARVKLAKLSNDQFYTLCSDVEEELRKRFHEKKQSNVDEHKRFHLPLGKEIGLQFKRQSAKMKLSNLSESKFSDLVNDLYLELRRRGFDKLPQIRLPEEPKRILPHDAKDYRSKKSLEYMTNLALPQQPEPNSPSSTYSPRVDRGKEAPLSTSTQSDTNNHRGNEAFTLSTENKVPTTVQTFHVQPKVADIEWEDDDEEKLTKLQSVPIKTFKHEQCDVDLKRPEDLASEGLKLQLPYSLSHKKANKISADSSQTDFDDSIILGEGKLASVPVRAVSKSKVKMLHEEGSVISKISNKSDDKWPGIHNEFKESIDSNIQDKRVVHVRNTDNLNKAISESPNTDVLHHQNFGIENPEGDQTRPMKKKSTQTYIHKEEDGKNSTFSSYETSNGTLISSNSEPVDKKQLNHEYSLQEKYFLDSLSSLNSQVNKLSIENENLKQQIIDIEMRYKTGSSKNPHTRDNIFKDCSANTKGCDLRKYVSDEGVIPLMNYENFLAVFDDLMLLIISKNELDIDIFRKVAEINTLINSTTLCLETDAPEFSMLKAALSHFITAIRHHASYGRLLSKLSLEVPLCEVAYQFGHLISLYGLRDTTVSKQTSESVESDSQKLSSDNNNYSSLVKDFKIVTKTAQQFAEPSRISSKRKFSSSHSLISSSIFSTEKGPKSHTPFASNSVLSLEDTLQEHVNASTVSKDQSLRSGPLTPQARPNIGVTTEQNTSVTKLLKEINDYSKTIEMESPTPNKPGKQMNGNQSIEFSVNQPQFKTDDIPITTRDQKNHIIDRNRQQNFDQAYSDDDGSTYEYNMDDPENNLTDLLYYVEAETIAVVTHIQGLLTSVKQPDTSYVELLISSADMCDTVEDIVTATEKMMARNDYSTLRKKVSWVVDGLKDCIMRTKEIRRSKEDNNHKDGDMADKQFRRKLTGVAFDITKCTKELVKIVESTMEELGEDQ